MDWYYGNGIDELVVPQYQDISDRLPSPDSWSKWGTTTSERIGSPNKCFLQESNLKEQELSFDGNSLCNEVELDTSHDKDDSNGSSICEGLLEGAFYWRSPSHDRPDYQLDDLEGVEQTNDIFLSSLLEDLPEMEAIDESFEFSPESPHCGGLSSDNLDSRSMWIDVNNTVGKSKYPKRHAFSSLMGRDNQDVTAVQFIPCNSEQMDCAPIKFGEDIVSSEQNGLNENSGQEKSPEESVLEELEMVMAQLTEKTQICFRDALYRLAKNSEHHDMETQEEGGYLDTEKPPPWTLHDIKMRPASQKAMESETNAIDRAVANLMFNDMDFSVIREHSSSASVNFTGVIGEREPPVNSMQNVVRSTRPMRYSFNQPKIQHVSHRSISQGDAEVPRLAQIDRDNEFM
ncbi:protein LNK3-like isoform X2 [Juglans microcarpa x Juglans regia]|uniref:protein LNK3-like isoform X2 n=1 Tax=Juglans microcarpa x Juglans regia TaxID=2249226 RepID=UPI001B7ECE1F|nr:protein LNK3-like isoform X2 [Juglans microcarpa x Juglans regia]